MRGHPPGMWHAPRRCGRSAPAARRLRCPPAQRPVWPGPAASRTYSAPLSPLLPSLSPRCRRRCLAAVPPSHDSDGRDSDAVS
eukprot:1173431-Prorocentrum_minimum.AAC.1